MNEMEKKRKANEAKHNRQRAINSVIEEIKDNYAGTSITQDELGEVMYKYGLEEVTQSEWTYMLREIAK
jgi:hypothetical protein